MTKLFVLVYLNQYITGLRSALIKNQAHIATAKLLFYLKDTEMFCRKLFWVTLNFVVQDCGYTKTVCGEEWLKCYIDSLSDLEK